MSLLFTGTISGQGTQPLSVEAVPTDVDISVITIGPHVSFQGPNGHRRLNNVGWMVFYNSNFGPPGFLGEEDVTDQIWFNHESEDRQINTVLGSTATHFAFWINPGSEVKVFVSGA